MLFLWVCFRENGLNRQNDKYTTSNLQGGMETYIWIVSLNISYFLILRKDLLENKKFEIIGS